MIPAPLAPAPTPSSEAIRGFLQAHRPALPPLLRQAVAAGLGLTAGYVGILAALFFLDRPAFQDMLRLTLLTIVAGREPAMLAVYQEPTPAPLPLTLFVAVIDDVATLLLCLVGWWMAYEALHGRRRFGAWLAGLEKEALLHQAWLRRWGLAGLAAFYWLPGLGTGNVAISAMGIAARIPLHRLLPVLLASGIGVNVFWAFALKGTAVAIPDTGGWEWLPAGVVGAAVAVGVASYLRRRRTRHLLLLPVPADGLPERLLALGFRPRSARIVEVDSHVLAAQAGLPPHGLGRLHDLAELLLVADMDLEAARALEGRGVAGARCLAVLPPGLVGQALAEAGVAVPPPARLAQWCATAAEWRLAVRTRQPPDGLV